MKIKNLIRRISSGRGFYITAAVSFALVVLSIVLVYRTSTGMIRDILTTSPDNITEEVRRNDTQQTDPRYTEEITEPSTTAPTTTEEQETSMAWAGSDRRETTEPTTEEETEPVIVNDSYVLPLTGDIQRDYSPTSPVYDETMGDWRVHKGIDFPAEMGSEVKSIGNGKVTKVMSDPSWGYIVEIDHGDFTARYCGLQQGSAVKPNEVISKGDTVGMLDVIPCEGEQEPHLHFEAVKDGKNVDPMAAMGIAAE